MVLVDEDTPGRGVVGGPRVPHCRRRVIEVSGVHRGRREVAPDRVEQHLIPAACHRPFGVFGDWGAGILVTAGSQQHDAPDNHHGDKQRSECRHPQPCPVVRHSRPFHRLPRSLSSDSRDSSDVAQCGDHLAIVTYAKGSPASRPLESPCDPTGARLPATTRSLWQQFLPKQESPSTCGSPPPQGYSLKSVTADAVANQYMED